MTHAQAAFSYGLSGGAAPPPAAVEEADAVALEEIERNGFTVLPAQLPPATVATMRAALDRVVRAQAMRFGGEAALAGIGEAMTGRALLNEDPIFLEALRPARLIRVVERLLGPAAIVLQQNGLIMPPTAEAHRQQAWHRDLPYQEWVCSRPLALGSLLVLDDFSATSGGTLFLPGSHHVAASPSRAFITRWQHQAEAAAGAIVVFNAMVLHRGGVNHGSTPRRAVNTLFGVPLLARQVAFQPPAGLEPRLCRLLTGDFDAAASADDWRHARLRRLRAEGPA